MSSPNDRRRARPRVAVTGANGFIGSAAVQACSQAGLDVVPIVRHGKIGDGARGVGDIGASTQWREALQGIDVVIHAAALAHGRGRSADEYTEVNVRGTRRLARQAAECGVRRLVFLSSVGVLGAETPQRPFVETDPVAPHNPYARAKAQAETALREVAEATGIEIVIVRPPLVHGPRAPGNFGRLVRWVERGVPLPLGAIEHNRRSIVGRANLADFLVVCATHPDAPGNVFLVADDEDLSTADLLRRTAHAMNRPARLWPMPAGVLRWAAKAVGKGEMADQLLGSLQVDINRAREVLGWNPPVSMDEGLRRAVTLDQRPSSGLSRD